MRICLGVEYNGKNYHGWQRQKDLDTVQLRIEAALSSVANHPISVVCAGRTDVGVHAKEQVIHFDTTAERKLEAWMLGSNSLLPKDICIKWAKPVNEDFHARFSAIARRYQYVIYNSKVRPAILNGLVTFHRRPLKADLMHAAGQHLLGEQDFSSFRGAGCQSKTAMRNVHHLKVTRRKNLVIIDIKANAFLLHMVRNIAGLLIAIGEEKFHPDYLKEILAKRDRKTSEITAPAAGLYLAKVYYPN
jgi:tRNA pseudouridine38-40 synthase